MSSLKSSSLMEGASGELTERIERFVREVVLPEEAHGMALHHAPEERRQRLVSAAKDAGVFGPHVPTEFGGHGLRMLDRARPFEAAGYSLLGPLALQAQAPDEGNLHMLALIASPSQRERFLAPLARGEVRSCFAMTEPGGAGADPDGLTTRAVHKDGRWVLQGHKWFISGAHGAAFAIVMARTSGMPGDRGGATMFLVPMNAPGLREERVIQSLDEGFFGGHSELTFSDVEVGDEDVLGAVDEGHRHAQARLGPARLTHCMRWLGIAQRSQDLALTRANTRRAFGGTLGELGMVQQLLADNEIDLEASRSLLWRACAELDQGKTAIRMTSIAKTFVSEAVNRIVDRSVQVCGALGISFDLPLSRFLREVRPFRVYDGPSEVHRWSIARRALRDAQKRGT